MDARSKFFARMDASVESERSKMDEPSLDGADIDFDFTESGRTMVSGKYASGDDSTLDDMDFSIIASSRTLGNTERSMATIGTIGTIDTETSIGTVSSNMMDTAYSNTSTDSKSKEKKKTASQQWEAPENSASQQQSFHALVPLPEHPQRQRSAPRAIPRAQQQVVPPQQSALGPTSSLPSSAGSSGSAFLNSLLDPAASSFNHAHMSHTPPTHISTSYEASHFGKRARSGSISERLRVSTELEQKGMIDREQKGILKDLIISGQDNELQHALDKYEQGDASILETMLQSGTLSNRATTDIDLLGDLDLDLDFLNVNDGDIGDEASADHPYGSSNHPMQPPPSLPTREQAQEMNMPAAAPGTESYEATDGIGELDFDGGIGGSDGFAPMQSHERASSPMYHGQRSRSNSTFSMDLDYRQRSNSLFSALIGAAPPDITATTSTTSTPTTSTPTEYGRWMEQNLDPPYESAEGVRIDKPLRRASAPEIPSGLSVSLASQNATGDVKMSAATKRELKAEEKRRERLEKKELKEREKRERKEKREQTKLEKQKKAEMEEKEEHQPGSGRPRSMSDPNIRTSLDTNGLLQVERPDGWIGAYSPESRTVRIGRFLEKRNHRVWTKTVKYDVRKNFADSRLRVKGRFVKKEDELLMRELMSLT